MSDEMKMYSTRDITLATTLSLNGFEMINIDFQFEGDQTRPVGYFAYEDTEELKQFEKDFYAKKKLVEPLGFSSTLRGIKSQLNNEYKGPHSRFARKG